MKRLMFCPHCRGEVEPEEIRKCVKCGRVICDLCAVGEIGTGDVTCTKCAEREVKHGASK